MRILASFVGISGLSLALLAGCSAKRPTSAADSATAGPVAVTPTEGTQAASTATSSPPTPPAVATPAETAPTKPGGEKSKEPEKPAEPAKGEGQAPERINVDMKGLVAGLQSSYASQVYTAGEYFRQIPPAQRREVLLQLSKHDDPNVRGNAWRVFATVATKADLAVLEEALKSPFSDVQIAALETMARFPNEQTIGVLAKLLENADHRELAVGLLSRIGPACEVSMLPYATNPDAVIRRAAWDVLAEAGTRKSVQTLEQLSTQAGFQKDTALQRTLTRLRERLRKS